jgi:coenzyme F420-reducing hydrogenase delta subunit/ferredoxin
LKREPGSLPRVPDPVDPKKVSTLVLKKTRDFSRSACEMLTAEERVRGFDEVASVLSEDLAVQEALRCLHCHLGAKVDQEACVSCLTCVRVCPLEIPYASKMGEITISPVDCQACGMCAMECPVRAIDISLHSEVDILEQMEQEIGGSDRPDPLVVGFFDLHGNFGLEDLENLRKNYPGLVPVTVFGLRRIDTLHVLRAFELGADAVLLAACPQERDPYPDIGDRITGRVASVMTLIDMLGLGRERVKICDMPEKGLIRDTDIDELLQKIKEIGSSPLRV